MSRTVYVNGLYLPEAEACVSIFDRGFLFADGVYEVAAVLNGKLIDNSSHLQRLHRSLGALKMRAPASDEQIQSIQRELITLNDLSEGLVYLQVTRGAADRDFAYPADAVPTLVMFTQSKPVLQNPLAESGISVVTTPDIRWGRRDIKTVGLLAACMAKMIAHDRGANDAWMVEKGKITEGSASNAFIVTDRGKLVTRHLSNEILHGITRHVVLQLAAESGVQFEERAFSVEEAYRAQEAFLTSASALVLPVVELDGKPVGEGKPGPLSKRIRELYIARALATSD